MNLSDVKHLPRVDHTPAELDRVSRLLLRAADILERGGHCKGKAEIGTAHCLSGAVTCASFEFGQWGAFRGHTEAFNRLEKAIIGNPVAWNDAPERTKDEVIAKVRAVALGL